MGTYHNRNEDKFVMTFTIYFKYGVNFIGQIMSVSCDNSTIQIEKISMAVILINGGGETLNLYFEFIVQRDNNNFFFCIVSS